MRVMKPTFLTRRRNMLLQFNVILEASKCARRLKNIILHFTLKYSRILSNTCHLNSTTCQLTLLRVKNANMTQMPYHRSRGNELRTYRTFNENYGEEQYVRIITIKYRTAYTKFRYRVAPKKNETCRYG